MLNSFLHLSLTPWRRGADVVYRIELSTHCLYVQAHAHAHVHVHVAHLSMVQSSWKNHSVSLVSIMRSEKTRRHSCDQRRRHSLALETVLGVLCSTPWKTLLMSRRLKV